MGIPATWSGVDTTTLTASLFSDPVQIGPNTAASLVLDVVGDAPSGISGTALLQGYDGVDWVYLEWTSESVLVADGDTTTYGLSATGLEAFQLVRLGWTVGADTDGSASGLWNLSGAPLSAGVGGASGMPGPYHDWFQAIVPAPMQTPKGLTFAGGLGAAKDWLLARLKIGIKQRFPSYAFPDALTQIGVDRMLPAGPDDTPQTYAATLLNAWEIWPWGGLPFGLLSALNRAGFGQPVMLMQNLYAWQLAVVGDPGTWLPSTVTAPGTVRRPISFNGFEYQAIQGASHATAATEPDWPIVISGQVQDGLVIWECIGTLPAPYLFQTNLQQCPAPIGGQQALFDLGQPAVVGGQAQPATSTLNGAAFGAAAGSSLFVDVPGTIQQRRWARFAIIFEQPLPSGWAPAAPLTGITTPTLATLDQIRKVIRQWGPPAACTGITAMISGRLRGWPLRLYNDGANWQNASAVTWSAVAGSPT